MQGLNLENIVILLIGLGVLYLVFKILKGVLKTIISVILIFTIGISLYNIFIVKKPLSYEISRYTTDISYFKDVNKINKEAYDAIEEIKENKNIVANIKNLQNLEDKAEKLKHSQEIRIIHDQYISNFKKIILVSKGYNTANSSKKYITSLDNLSGNMDIRLKEILFSR